MRVARFDYSWVSAAATFILDERRISVSEQRFLLNVRAQARDNGPRFAMSKRQAVWFESIVDQHARALPDHLLLEGNSA